MHEVLDEGARDDEAAVDLGDVVGGRLGDLAPAELAPAERCGATHPRRLGGGDLPRAGVQVEVRVGRVGSPVERALEPLQEGVGAGGRARKHRGRVADDQLAHAAGLERVQPGDAHVAVALLIVQKHVAGELAAAGGWLDLGRLHDVELADLARAGQPAQRKGTRERTGAHGRGGASRGRTSGPSPGRPRPRTAPR